MLFAIQWLWLLAEDQPAQQSPLSGPIILLPVLALLFWLFMIRPMRKQEKERQNLLSHTKKNDKVVTSSGIIGTVVIMGDDEVVIQADDKVRLKMIKGSIVRNITQEEAAKNNSAQPSASTPAKPEEAAKG